MGRLLLTLEIDPTTQPFHGHLHIAGSSEQLEFCGWIELVQLLDGLLGKPGANHGRDRRQRG